jgi:hypothetical protein
MPFNTIDSTSRPGDRKLCVFFSKGDPSQMLSSTGAGWLWWGRVESILAMNLHSARKACNVAR